MKLFLFNTNLATKDVLSRLSGGEECVLFTDQTNIKELIEVLDFQYVNLYYIKSAYWIFSLSSLVELFKMKKKVKSIFEHYNIDSVYIYHMEFGEFFNWIIKFAINNGVPIYNIKVLKDVSLKKSCSLRGIKYAIIHKLLYGFCPIIYSSGSRRVYPKIPQKMHDKYFVDLDRFCIDGFLKQCTDKVLKKCNLLNTKGKVVLLTGSVVSTREIDAVDYQSVIEMVVERYGKDNIVCKCHPRFNDEIPIERELVHIPSFIPMELLFDIFDTYIGVGSAVLINASKQGKECISLLDLFSTTSERFNKGIKKYFEGTDIKFVQSI